MSANRKTVLGVIFGGRSVEHDVSIVTAQQIMQACDPQRYEVVPLYITRDGKWYTGASLRDIKNFKEGRITEHDDVQSVVLSPDVRQHGLIVNPLPSGLFAKSKALRLDVVFPAVHGSHGEDGTLQGLFELADIPYVGYATLGSALTNDKVMTKAVLQQAGLPVVEGVSFTRSQWQANPDYWIEQIQSQLGLPVFVKPATLGSSIGVNRAADAGFLRIAIDIAANFDRRILVEKAVTDCVEINCSVIGYENDVKTSVLEQPIHWDDFLSYEDKYLRGGSKGMKSAERVIPAPLSPELTARVQEIAKKAFLATDGRGIVRIDFLVQPETNTIYLNEMNTMPGSLALYLWEATGMTAPQVIDRLVALARTANADKRRNVYDYQSNLINVAASSGLKGTKGKLSTSQTHSPDR